MNKYPKSESDNNEEFLGQEAYVSWGDDLASKKEALKLSSESLEEFTGIQKATGGRRHSLDYSNLDTNTSSRPGLTKSDYYYFRPDEEPPRNLKNILKKAEDIYNKVGLVKNVIDLMGDFSSQGIRLVHPTRRIEKFYQTWFKKINGKERSERFLNNLYKTGNVIIHKQSARLNRKSSQQMFKASATSDIKISDLEDKSIESKEIPWKYTFIDPYYVDVYGGAISSFSNAKRYQLSLPAKLRKTINNPKNPEEQDLVNKLPPAIVEAAKHRKAYPLDPDKTFVYHYKKDDWQSWAFPMIYSIMDDITIIEKLKLADMAALDGAISNIRIFKLGNLEHKIAPTKAATSKLAQILGNNVGGGTMDLVWGPDIELIESKTNVHQFLGEGKYTPHLNSIYAGLGIPPTLTGTFGAAGTTNNFISLKTLTQRLQYGRDMLARFWEQEIIALQKAMGFRAPAFIEFDRMDLSNEEAEKSLLIQLADRNLISDELIQTKFDINPNIEKARITKESRRRKTGKMSSKASPYHDANLEGGLKKIALQSGTVTPGEVGLELESKGKNQKTKFEMQQDLKGKSNPPTKLGKDEDQSLPDRPGKGRPKNSRDTEKRKTKEFAPQTGAKIMLWACGAQDKIDEIINPIILEYFNKKNLRSLSSEEYKHLENLKTQILFELQPFGVINSESVVSFMNTTKGSKLINNYNNWLIGLKNDSTKPLTVEEQRNAKAIYYTNQHVRQ